MKEIAIFGAGGLGRETYCMIQAINKIEPTWNFIGFFDDGKDIGSFNEYGKILGGVNEVNSYSNPLSLVIAIANGAIIEKIVSKITNNNISYPNIIAPNVIFYDLNNIKLGIGNILGFNSVISCNFNIGNFNILSCSVVIGHDLDMKNYNILTNCCKISGHVQIASRTFWGAGSIILPPKTVVSDTIIGAGAVVISNITNSGTYVGNPARKVK